MFIGSSIGNLTTKPQQPVKFGAIYRITENSDREVAEASEKLQNAGIFISRFFQGSDRYLAANEKSGKGGRGAGQDASAVAGAFKLRKSEPQRFTSTLRTLILKKHDKGEIKRLSEVDNHPALSSQKVATASVFTEEQKQSPTDKKTNPFQTSDTPSN